MLRIADLRFSLHSALRRSRICKISVIVLASLVSLVSVASEEKPLEQEMTLIELAHYEKNITVLMHMLLGEVSHSGGNRFNSNDEKEVFEAISSTLYLGRYFEKMEEVCSYYRSTPISSIDVTILASAQSEAQRLELIDKIYFFESTLDSLSAETRNLANQLRESVITNQPKFLTEPLDFHSTARNNPDGYKENFQLICERTDKLRLDVQSGKGIYSETPITIKRD